MDWKDIEESQAPMEGNFMIGFIHGRIFWNTRELLASTEPIVRSPDHPNLGSFHSSCFPAAACMAFGMLLLKFLKTKFFKEFV